MLMASCAHPAATNPTPTTPRAALSPRAIPPDALALVEQIVSHPEPFGSSSYAAYDPSSAKWVVYDYRHEEGEDPALSWAGFVDTQHEESLELSPRDARLDGAYLTSPNLVDGYAQLNGVLAATRPLVRFGELYLFVERASAQNVFHLFRLRDSVDYIVAEVPVASGPVDEAACRAEMGADVACTPMDASLSITDVRRAPDGSSLLIQGYVTPPDHRAAGPFHVAATSPL